MILASEARCEAPTSVLLHPAATVRQRAQRIQNEHVEQQGDEDDDEVLGHDGDADVGADGAEHEGRVGHLVVIAREAGHDGPHEGHVGEVDDAEEEGAHDEGVEGGTAAVAAAVLHNRHVAVEDGGDLEEGRALGPRDRQVVKGAA